MRPVANGYDQTRDEILRALEAAEQRAEKWKALAAEAITLQDLTCEHDSRMVIPAMKRDLAFVDKVRAALAAESK